MANISFKNNIQPLFKQFQGPMMWRFDLSSYDDVKANAQLIYSRICNSEAPMPPPPFPRLTDSQIKMFKDWMDNGFSP
ncbi:MAG: hypothetical protein QNJ55_22740 [Xenococcus sp. MO_188.B8]|nr:hypothetical protein [Xenococcus sp. MO_188.B8]